MLNQRVLIIGAGEAGRMLGQEIVSSFRDCYELVGFLDDDINKIGKYFSDRKVWGKVSSLCEMVSLLEVDEVIIAVPSASGEFLRYVVEECNKAKIRCRLLPLAWEIIHGGAYLYQLREVKLEDFFNPRDIVEDCTKIKEFLKDKIILVTGAGGSIGSELCKQIKKLNPRKLILLGRGENSIHKINLELNFIPYHNVEVIPVIADIRDKGRLAKIFKQYRPDIVFHTAAHKHISLMEKSLDEVIKNNVGGTKNIAEFCGQYDVKEMLFISTDKAVDPVSYMGKSKRVCEILMKIYREKYINTKYITVRLGNVIGSRGSVLEIFHRQLDRGEPLTLTHPDMERYFMISFDAVLLILQALLLGDSGSIFIRKLSNKIKIVDLVKMLLKLRQKEEDYPIIWTGIQEGERLSEVLVGKEELLKDTGIVGIYEVIDTKLKEDDFLVKDSYIDFLLKYAEGGNFERMLHFLNKIL